MPILPRLSTSRKQVWRVLVPLGTGTILALMGDLTLYAVLPAYAATRAFSLIDVGLLLSANRLIRLASNPLVGLLLAGTRRRGFVLAGFGLGALSTLLYVLAPGSALFLAGRLLWGLSWSMIYIGGYTMVMDSTTLTDRGWASGILQGFYFVGLALDPLLGGWLSDRLGFTSALTICAALSGLGFLATLFTLPETSPSVQVRSAPFLTLLRAFWADWKQRLAALKVLARPQNLAVNYVYFTANFVGDGILLSTLSLFLKTHYDSAFPLAGWVLPVATASGLLLAARAVVSAAIAPAAGLLSDRAGRWQITGAGLGIGAIGLAAIVWLKTPLALLLGVTLTAAGGAVVLTIAPPLAREINPRLDSGAILGLLANSADLGMALAPLITYALLDRLPLEIIYALAGLMLLLGLPLIWGSRRAK